VEVAADHRRRPWFAVAFLDGDLAGRREVSEFV
jgi:hypothetical protein